MTFYVLTRQNTAAFNQSLGNDEASLSRRKACDPFPDRLLIRFDKETKSQVRINFEDVNSRSKPKLQRFANQGCGHAAPEYRRKKKTLGRRTFVRLTFR